MSTGDFVINALFGVFLLILFAVFATVGAGLLVRLFRWSAGIETEPTNKGDVK